MSAHPDDAEDRSLTLGFGLPQHVEAGSPIAAIHSLAVRAEQANFDGVWTSEVPTASMLDPLTVLAHVSGVTQRVRLGVGVLLLPLRTPATLARDLASIDYLSGGRLSVGFGYGRKRDGLYSQYGLSTSKRLERYLDNLDTVVGLLEQGAWPATDGHVPDAQRVRVAPTVQRPRPPIWLAARSEPALRRVARIGDGWIGSSRASREELERSLATLHDELQTVGRDPSTFRLINRIFISIDSTPEARQRLRDTYGARYGDPDLADAAVLTGSTQLLLERVSELAELGTHHVILNPVFEFDRHLDLLASEVVPQLAALGRG